MATLDFTPMFRSTIGFDRLPQLLADAYERVFRAGNRLSNREFAKRLSEQA